MERFHVVETSWRTAVRKKDANDRIRELEAELARQRIEREASEARFAAELDLLRRQAQTRREAQPVYLGNLTQSQVNAKIRKREFGSYSDGGCLQLDIRPGAKSESAIIASWLFRWTETLRPGKQRTRSMGLGSARVVSLQAARKAAQHLREVRKEGKDPMAERLERLCEAQSAKDLVRTLEQVGEEYIEAKISMRSRGYQQRMRQVLRDNILIKEHKFTATGETIKVGAMPIQRVTRSIILKDCGFEQLWNEEQKKIQQGAAGNPTAVGLMGLLDKMYGYAREKGYYVGNSPMAWRGGLEHVLPAPKDVHRPKHHPALTYQNAPTFLQQHLRKHRYRRVWPIGTGPDGRSINSYMVELALLTGTRVGEIIAAEWQELDFSTMTWTVPWQHTKRHEPDQNHRMPITRSMLSIFQLMQQIRTDPSPQAPIFPSHHKRWVQSHRRVGSGTLLRVVKQLAPGFGEEFVNHGFRSTLKDWCQANGYPDSWYQEQVHHKEKGKVNQAYGQDDLLEQRRGMMAAYDAYLNTAPQPAKDKEADNIIDLTNRRKA
jgi:integrase